MQINNILIENKIIRISIQCVFLEVGNAFFNVSLTKEHTQLLLLYFVKRGIVGKLLP